MECAMVFNVQKYSVHDGPGIRTTVFLKGCPLRCQWCANPESNERVPQLLYYPDKCAGCLQCVSVCPGGAIVLQDGKLLFDRMRCTDCLQCAAVCRYGARKRSGEERTTEEIWQDVIKDRIFYETSGGGVTFSGGEPLLWPAFVAELGRRLKNEGINTAVETCGYFPPEHYEAVKDCIDYILFDLKLMDSEKHDRYCGAPNDVVLENFKRIARSRDVIVRMPVIPAINDNAGNLEAMVRFLEPYRGHVAKIHLLPYHNLGLSKYDALQRSYLLGHIVPPADEQMQALQAVFVGAGYTVQIGG